MYIKQKKLIEQSRAGTCTYRQRTVHKDVYYEHVHPRTHCTHHSPVGEPPVGRNKRSLSQQVEEDEEEETAHAAARVEVLEVVAHLDRAFRSFLLLLYARYVVRLATNQSTSSVDER